MHLCVRLSRAAAVHLKPCSQATTGVPTNASSSIYSAVLRRGITTTSLLEKGGGAGLSVKASRGSHNSINPIRRFEEGIFLEDIRNARNRTDMEFIKLSVGDTTALPVHQVVPRAVKSVLDSGTSTGYGHSSGLPETRRAIAELYSPFTCDRNGIDAEHVVMTSGCAGALEMSLQVLVDHHQNILVPSPGFSLYPCLAGAQGIECRYYRVQPDRSWEADLNDLESKIDSNTATIVLNNPSNPCGSSYSRQHLLDIITVAEKHRLPILADETYAWMAFPGKEFHMLSSLSETVPILSCSSMSKRFMIPGWRMGWIVIHDRQDAFKEEIIPGLRRLATKIQGPCGLVQAAIPEILASVPDDYHQRNLELLHKNATHIFNILSSAPGVMPVMSEATMYSMVLLHLEHFPEFETDLEFTKALIAEQNVFCLPGQAFNISGCFRVVLSNPESIIKEACHRIVNFAKQHYKP